MQVLDAEQQTTVGVTLASLKQGEQPVSDSNFYADGDSNQVIIAGFAHLMLVLNRPGKWSIPLLNIVEFLPLPEFA